MDSTQQIQHRLERIETLIHEAEQFTDPAARAHVQEIVQGLLDYHGAGIARIVELIKQHGPPSIMQALAADDLTASLLLLYDLHPVELSTRVEQALSEVRPFLKSHGGEVELLSLDDGIVRLRMHGSCDGCPSSMLTLKGRIEQAIYKFAPDAAGIAVEGLTPTAPNLTPAGFVPLELLAR